MIVAGAYGAATVSKRILYVQAAPAALALIVLWLAQVSPERRATLLLPACGEKSGMRGMARSRRQTARPRIALIARTTPTEFASTSALRPSPAAKTRRPLHLAKLRFAGSGER